MTTSRIQLHNSELTGWKYHYALMAVLLLALTGYSGCTRQSDDIIRADSAVVLSEFGSGRVFVTTTIRCEGGKVWAAVSSNDVLSIEAGGRVLLTENVEIRTEAYLRLWSELERNDVWSLPAGEIWNWIDWMQAGHGFPKSVPRSEAYQDPPIDCGFAAVTVRAGAMSHGFLWWCPRALKNARYQRIIVAITDLEGMREARIKVTGP